MCEFGPQEELIIRDKIVFGVRDERSKERLLRKGEVTLQKALDICHVPESSRQQLDVMKGAKHVSAMDKERQQRHTTFPKQAKAKPAARAMTASTKR